MSSSSFRLPEGISIYHLQLPNDDMMELLRSGITTLDNLSALELQKKVAKSTLRNLETALVNLTQSMEGERINWKDYWKRMSGNPLYFAFIPSLKNPPCSSCLSAPLDDFNWDFGALINIPKREGMVSLADLTHALHGGRPLPNGFGYRKLIRLAKILEEVLDRLCQCSLNGNDEAIPGNITPLDPDYPYASLPEEAASLPISVFGLGAKTAHLKAIGWHTLADLPLHWESQMMRTGNVGAKTTRRVQQTISAIRASIYDQKLDMDMLAEKLDIRFFPQEVAFNDLPLPEKMTRFISTFAEADRNPMTAEIAKRRINVKGSDTATLEEIGDGFGVTRERIRQIERKFLANLRSTLVDPYHNRNFILRDEFLKPFERLAEAMVESETLTPMEVAELMAEIWECPLVDAVQALPKMIAIIEGSARTDGTLRRLGDTPLKLFEKLPRKVGQHAVNNLGLGKSIVRKCERLGVMTARDMRMGWINGLDFKTDDETIMETLSAIVESGSGHELDVGEYCNARNMDVVPYEPGEWADYIKTLIRDVRIIIKTEAFWPLAPDIYDRRTSLPLGERQTLQKIADIHDTHGPTIKRTETETLDRLREITDDRNPFRLELVLREDWLDMWQVMSERFERFKDNQVVFRNSVRDATGSTEEDVETALPLIWGVLSGKLTRKKSGTIRIDNNPAMVMKPVKLSGFRRKH